MPPAIRTILLLILLGPLASYAQFRKYSNEFLNIGAGARGLSMASAQVASVDDGSAGYWNPAGLVYVEESPQLHLMHAEYFAGIGKYDYASLALPLKGQGRVIGLSMLRFGVDDIPNTVFLVEPDGTINFSNVQTFSSADYAFLLSMAQEFTLRNGARFNGGINAKVIHRAAGDFAKSWGFGFDAGLQYSLNNLRLGLVVRDVTSTFNAWSFNLSEKMREVFFVTQNDIPVRSLEWTAPRVIAGGAYTFPLSDQFKLLTELNLDFTFDGRRNTIVSGKLASIDPKLGMEASWKDAFFVRAGINNFQKALDDADENNVRKVWIYQPAFGVGFKLSNVRIDYAFTNLANQSNPLYTHVFSIRADLVKKGTK